jgi:Spy/CpxP family protein refolding chaperone
MKRFMSGLAILAATTMLPSDADAQRGRRGDQGPGMRGGMDGAGVESIMRLRDRLELSDDQIQQLDALRQESVARRTQHQAQMQELRSQLASGQIEREALAEVVEMRREASEGVRTQMQERIDGILTEAQRDELGDLRDQGRAFMRGRASAGRGGSGMRQGRGGRGMRGARGGGFDRGRGFRRGRGFDRGPGIALPGARRWDRPARDFRPFRRSGIGG